MFGLTGGVGECVLFMLVSECFIPPWLIAGGRLSTEISRATIVVGVWGSWWSAWYYCRVMFIFEVAGSCRIDIAFSRGFVRLFSLGQELILVTVVTMPADWSWVRCTVGW